MIGDQLTIEKVKHLGLNSYEAKIWTALLSKGVATSGELSDIANVPRSRSYDVLESLEAKGFVVMKLGKPIKYIAVPPTEVIERIKSRIKQDTEDRAKLLEEFKTSELFDQLTFLHDTGIESVDPTDLSGIIKGRKQIFQKIQEGIINAKKEAILIIGIDELNKEKKYILSGIRKNKNNPIITVFAPKQLESDLDRQLAEHITVKQAIIKARLAIFDKNDVLFMLMDSEDVHPNYDSAVWVKSPFFAQSVQTMLISRN
ncbi:MAG: TrmB family transcriptional regulator [Candidatus Woesearchaeota archaeon]